ncbi:MAG: GIY-YIG nuclease family protein [Candidatus Magasanikbacteria bacterium]|nr:GIY-YIG nuclease family protein [Candidatus Magasanikbacteria bacterium]
MYYVYLLISEKDKGYYIGYSNDLQKRFKNHCAGEVESTIYRRPLQLVYYEAYLTEELARERERKLKEFGSAYTGLIKRLHLKSSGK